MRDVKVLVILDKSGSMDSCKNETIRGFNEQVQVIRKNAQKVRSATVSLITFNENVDFDFFNQAPDKLVELTSSNYKPDGMTALNDAIGMTLDRIEKVVKDNEELSYLVTIISDGDENASKEYADVSKLRQRIEQLEATGRWTFTYMGANQDMLEVQRNYGIRADNVTAYDATPQGTLIANSLRSTGTMSYFSAIGNGETGLDGFYKDAPKKASLFDDSGKDAWGLVKKGGSK